MYITVTSHKGGVGKSITAIHLAGWLAERHGAGSTVLVDTDRNASSLAWAERGEARGFPPSFSVVDLEAEVGNEEHVVYDSPGRLDEESLIGAVRGSDLLVVPTTPEMMAIDALLVFIEDLEEIGGANYRVLLTMVPWWDLSGKEARQALQERDIPVFNSMIRRRKAFETASQAGVIVRDVRKRRAMEGWEDYGRVLDEIVTQSL